MALIQVCVFNPITTFIDPVVAAATGPAAPGVPVITNASGQIDSSLLGAGVQATAGQTMSAGSLVNLYGSSGSLFMQLASAQIGGTSPSGGTYPVQANGFISLNAFAAGMVTVNFFGTFQYIDANSEFSAANIGQEVYLSAVTQGGVTLTPPTGLEQSVGYVANFTAPNVVTISFASGYQDFTHISGTNPITKGGTGASNAPAALTALGAGSYTAKLFYASPVSGTGALSARAFALSDIPQSGATNGQAISWNGSAWAPTSGTAVGFSSITSGTNTTALMTVGSGAQLVASGSGVIMATQLATTGFPVVITAAPPTVGQVLTATSATTTAWETASGGTPGGTSGQVQINLDGAFAGQGTGGSFISMDDPDFVSDGIILIDDSETIGIQMGVSVGGITVESFGTGNTTKIIGGGASIYFGALGEGSFTLTSGGPIVIQTLDANTLTIDAVTCVFGSETAVTIGESLYLAGKMLDVHGSQGTAGQTLTSTGSGVVWVSGGSTPIINPQTGTSYTAEVADGNNIVTMNNAAANTFIVPLSYSYYFLLGTVFTIMQIGAGQTTLAGAVGVTINTPSSLTTRAQWSTVSMIQIATNVWVAGGDLS